MDVWAQKKLNNLYYNTNENEKKIIAHAKKHNLVTPFTSLIVLDRLEDYLEQSPWV